MVAQWLKAGVVENGRLSPHRGGNSSRRGGQPRAAERRPARDGAGRRGPLPDDQQDAGQTVTGSPVLIRYADDLVALCHSRDEALEVKARLASWLAPRGLVFNEDKTRVVSLEEGFDFLGFNVRRYHGKLLIKPSKAAIRRVRERLRTEMRSLRGANARAVHQTAQPDHPGLGSLLPGSGVQRGVLHAGRATSGSSRGSGRPSATPTSRSPGSSPSTSTSSTSPGATGGYSATAKAAPTCTSSPGPRSSDTR